MMNNEFAPIIIPTLNRYDHFRSCVESLSRCTGADKTVLIIGLDYPPSKKYEEGYNCIKEYIPKINGFARVVVLEATENLGSFGNYNRIKQYAKELGFTSFIFTEDDNIVSPNFLEYMNWGLSYFKDDSSIISICGYKRVNVDFLQNNVYKYRGHNAWGFGSWFEKWSGVESLMNRESVAKILKSKSLFVVFTRRIKGCYSLMRMLKYNQFFEDSFPYHLPQSQNFSIFPRVSLVKNMGHDGSGEHCGQGGKFDYSGQIIDANESFVPCIKDSLKNPKVAKAYNKEYRLPIKARATYAVSFIVYRLTGNLWRIK